MTDLKYLNKARGYVRTQLSKLHAKIDEDIGSMSLTDRKIALAKCEQFEVDLTKYDDSISALIWDPDKDVDTLMNEEFSKRETYSQKLLTCKIELKSSIEADLTVRPSNEGWSGNKFKLPEIPLPEFSNAKGETLSNFLTSFEAIISRYKLSPHEQFICLKRQLKGEPRTLVDSLDESQHSYEHGIDLLKQAFASEVTQKYDAIKRMTLLKLTYGESPYEYVSEMRVLRDLFKTLKINSDTILQYFIWSGMNVSLQNQLVHICNKNRPDLTEIFDNIFMAIDRYNEVAQRFKTKTDKIKKSNNHVASFATNVTTDGHSYNLNSNINSNSNQIKSKNQFCSLCSEGAGAKVRDHATYNCPAYTTAIEKCGRLRKLGACMRCGYINHATEDCSFKFIRSCYKCQGKHMSFLCTNDERTPKPEVNISKTSKPKNKPTGKPVSEINTGTIWMEAVMHSRVGSESVLPTFSCMVGSARIRAMKDSGCQPHFIRADLAKRLNLPIVSEDYTINIKGFNECRKFKTNIVNVPLNINQTIINVNAICVPKINTSLKLPGLSSLVKAFISKGYKLADTYLLNFSDEIKDIDFILGTSDPHVLLENHVAFGEQGKGVYSDTCLGILLMGVVDDTLADLASLPCKSEDACSVFLASVSSITNPYHNNYGNYKIEQIVQASNVVFNKDDLLDDKLLKRATDHILGSHCQSLLYEDSLTCEAMSDENIKITQYLLNNLTRNDEGRLIVPLTWKGNVAHLLGKNLNLAQKILNSNFKKWIKEPSKLRMIDDVFQEQLKLGIIDKIDNWRDFVEDNPGCSFLAFMAIFRPQHETTKTRVVYLSNLCESTHGQPTTLSHNQTISPGPSLNHKITTAVTHMRFGEKLLCYDLRKAFLQLALEEKDSNKLLFLWYKNVAQGDYTLVCYRNLRLSFGLRASPFILMISLYKILIMDSIHDDKKVRDFKILLYHLLYMDNGAVTGDSQYIKWAYSNLESVFAPYKFSLQQMVTNDVDLQTEIDNDSKEVAPENVKLLGLNWNRKNDKLSVQSSPLNSEAKTKRAILSSIAEVYDIFNIQGPCLNRARLFLHALQCDSELGWDTDIDIKSQHEWEVICTQFNKMPAVEIDRNVGNRSDGYKLISFCDASKTIYATVLYIQNMRTKKVSFLLAKNKLVNKQLQNKTIPNLELQGLSLAVDTLFKVYDELAGEKCVVPILIREMQLFTDSTICLHWLNSYSNTMDKMQKLSVFTLNRLKRIVEQCDKFPITISHVVTNENPADCMSRAVSHNQLLSTCYHTGPAFLTNNLPNDFNVLIPNPKFEQIKTVESSTVSGEQTIHIAILKEISHPNCVEIKRFGTLHRLVNTMSYVSKFIRILRNKIAHKYPDKYSHLFIDKEENYRTSLSKLISLEQKACLPDIINYLSDRSETKREIPGLVLRINPFIDSDGLVKVKSKFDRWQYHREYSQPILLPPESHLTELIIRDAHIKMSHAGSYSLLNSLRKQFWIPQFFSKVKKLLKGCVVCRRFNARTVKLNQNSYRDFRMNPPNVPFQSIFIDHLGPVYIRLNDQKIKIWLLVVSCMWTRAVNLKVCFDLSVRSFLQALQIHFYEHGNAARIFSDLGSQFTVGGKVIVDFLNNVEIKNYLSDNGIKEVSFQQYSKGNSSLGSMVEVCVKMVKRLLFGAVRNNVLSYPDFHLIMSQTINLVNKRPIGYHHCLAKDSPELSPSPITPELLVYGRELVNCNVMPQLEPDPIEDPNWNPNINSPDTLYSELAKLRKVRTKLIEDYNEEFTNNLISQAINDKDRYKPISHDTLDVGDVILLKETLLKPSVYPLAIVRKVVKNSLNEVTDVIAFKGKTQEIVKRHSSSIIPLYRPNINTKMDVPIDTQDAEKKVKRHTNRSAAHVSRAKTASMLG